jgi:hypothetical protein
VEVEFIIVANYCLVAVMDVARNIGPAKPEALRAESGFCQDGNESTDAFGSDFSSSLDAEA